MAIDTPAAPANEIPDFALRHGAGALHRLDREQSTRRMRWRLLGKVDWIDCGMREWVGADRAAAAAAVRKLRAIAEGEGIAPREFWRAVRTSGHYAPLPRHLAPRR